MKSLTNKSIKFIKSESFGNKKGSNVRQIGCNTLMNYKVCCIEME